MFKQRNMFLVLNPLQLICAQEARERFCAEEFNHLVLLNRKGAGSLEYRQKINELDNRWSKITQLSEPTNKGLIRNISRLKNTFIILLHQGLRRGKVFLGDAHLNWLRYLGIIFGKEVTWLDDGASSINVIAKLRDQGLLNGPNPSTPKFFTLFGSKKLELLTHNAVITNDLLHFRRRKNRNQTLKPKTALFIGQWLSERGGVVKEQEIDILRKVAADHSGWTMKYICHRHESEEKLAEINTFMDVTALDVSIESMVLASEVVPQKIISWYSTALFTLKPMMVESEFLAIKVPLDHATLQQTADWLAVYEVLEEIGVPVRSYL